MRMAPGEKYALQNHNNNPLPLLSNQCPENPYRRLIRADAPAIKHQTIALRIASALLRYVEYSNLGRVLQAPCQVVLSRGIVMRPDILFIKKDRRGLIGKTALRGAPDLVIDLLSRTTRRKDLRSRKKIYADYGVQEYWLVDPDARTVDSLVWSELGYVLVGTGRKARRLCSLLLPELDLRLRDIFDED